MTTRNLTLIIAGGVSLGAYEAGVLEELLYALKHVNDDPNQDDIVLDVMTGGSAGSITAAFVARILMHDHENMKRVMHESWVRIADIDELLLDAGKGSLLSNELQHKLAKRFIHGSEDYPLDAANPSPAAPERLRLGFSLSNVVGIDYSIPYHQVPGDERREDRFPTTFFSDFVGFELEAGNSTSATYWRQIADAAIASGSFPVAFPPKNFGRKHNDYPGSDRSTNDFLPAPLPFYDGGMFNNEPLRQAIALSADQDGGILASDRTFLLVDPNLNKSKQKEKFLHAQHLGENVVRLVQMALGEMVARDWMRVGHINAQIDWRDKFVEPLSQMVDNLDGAQTAAQRQQIDAQIAAILAHKSSLGDTVLGDDYLNERLERIAEYHRAALDDIDTGSANTIAEKRTLLKRMVFVLNNASGLKSKTPMTLNVIGANKDQVGGEELSRFAGFFDQRIREHDYRVGRGNANRLIPKLLDIDPYPKENQQGGTLNALYDLDPAWRNLAAVRPRDLSRAKRQRFMNFAADKLAEALTQEPLKLWKIAAFLVKHTLIRAALKKVLELDKDDSNVFDDVSD